MLTNKKECVACGQRFTPEKEQVYVAFERKGVFQALAASEKLFDAMDCPHCGCQNVLAERLPKVEAADAPDALEGAEDGSEGDGK